MAAMSSFGSINAIIYTFSRGSSNSIPLRFGKNQLTRVTVKQAIGQADVLPWSRFWKQDDMLQRHEDTQRNGIKSVDEFLYKSPQGGLIVHWILSVILILATVNVKNTGEAVGFPGYLQTYIHCAVLGMSWP